MMAIIIAKRDGNDLLERDEQGPVVLPPDLPPGPMEMMTLCQL
jgi:hypothetical protein